MALKIKFIQINIYKGKYLEELAEFLKQENPDTVSMQEVTVNAFEYLKETLGMDGVYHIDVEYTNAPASRFGNAVLSWFPVKNSKVVVLKKFRPMSKEEFYDSTFLSDLSRHVLDVSLDIDGKIIHALSVHGAWTAPPTDTEESLRQAKIIADHLRSLEDPFVMGGDLNAVPQSKVVGIISKVAENWMLDSGVLQTTHPKIHKIVPRGFLIDYIFTSGDFALKSLNVPDVTVSDHLPVIAELELES